MAKAPASKASASKTARASIPAGSSSHSAHLKRPASASAAKPAASGTKRPGTGAPLPPLSNEQLRTLPVGASSKEAIAKATGGRIERVGGRSTNNTFTLVLWQRRFLYARVQDKQAPRGTAYNTSGLRKTVATDAAAKGKDLDHVASTGIEGGKMGNRYSLMGLVDKSVNRSHGATSESGPAPVRESAKAFRRGLNNDGKDHVSYMTSQQADKLAQKPSAGKNHSVLRQSRGEAERAKISDALLQSSKAQDRLKSASKPFGATQSVSKAQLRSQGRSR